MTVHSPHRHPAAPDRRSRAGSVPFVPLRFPRKTVEPHPGRALVQAATWPFRVIAVAAVQLWRRHRLRTRLEAMSDRELAGLLIERREIDAAVRDAFILWPGHPRWIANPIPRRWMRRFGM